MAREHSPKLGNFAADLNSRRESAGFGVHLKQNAQQWADDVLAAVRSLYAY